MDSYFVMSIANFNSAYLTPLLEKLNKEDKFCFLMKMDSKLCNFQFYNALSSYIVLSLIFQPRRITEK